jgi:hypothetical protein
MCRSSHYQKLWSRRVGRKSPYFKCTIFWGVTPWNSVEVIQRFGGTYWRHLQGRMVNKENNRNQAEELDRPCNSKLYVPSERPWISTGLHGVISQNTVLFTVAVLRTSNKIINDTSSAVMVRKHLMAWWLWTCKGMNINSRGLFHSLPRVWWQGKTERNVIRMNKDNDVIETFFLFLFFYSCCSQFGA